MPLVRFSGQYINSNYILSIKHFADFKYQTNSSIIITLIDKVYLHESIPNANKVQERLDQLLSDINRTSDMDRIPKMRSDISKLRRQIKELEDALKYMSGGPEYQSAYKEFISINAKLETKDT